METQHRHDLKRNDLEEFFYHFGSWWNQHGMKIFLWILVCGALFVVGRWYLQRESLELEEAYTQKEMASSPGGKLDVATRFEHLPGLAGMCLLEAADLNAGQALFGDSGPGIEPAKQEEQRQESLKQASSLYAEVIALNQSPLQVFRARFGLAAVHESLGNFEAAAGEYAKIEKEAADQWPSLAAQAQACARTIPDLLQPVVLAPPKPAEEKIPLDPPSKPEPEPVDSKPEGSLEKPPETPPAKP